MKLQIKIFITSIQLIFISALLIITMTIVPNSYSDHNYSLSGSISNINPDKIGNELKEKIVTGQDKVVAQINGESIYKNEFEFQKLRNKLSYTTALKETNGDVSKINEQSKLKNDDEILKDVAKSKLIIKKAAEAGIIYSRDDAIERLKHSREQINSLIKAGHEETIAAVNEEKVFLDAIGMTVEEYIETIGAQLEMENITKVEYISYYYKTENEKKKTNPNYKIINYNDHLDEMLNQSNYSVIK